jgi:hypothetical protein
MIETGRNFLTLTYRFPSEQYMNFFALLMRFV